MELDHLRTFRAVARSGSFTAAADLLHYAQSTVSVHVRALETAVGAPLFDRLPGGARLTEAGGRLLPLAERILELADGSASVAREDAQAVGELTVAAPETVVAHRLPAILRCLRDRHPGLLVRLRPIPYHELLPAVSSGAVDVAFLLQPPLRSTSAYTIRRLRAEPLVLVAAPDHPLASPVDDVAQAFSQTTVFLTERGCGYRPLLEAHLDRAGVRPGDTLELTSVEAIRRCVEAGLGVALIPRAWLEEALRARTVVAMDWFASGFEVATQLAWNPSRWQGPALTAVIEASVATVGEEEPDRRRRLETGVGP